MGTPGRAFAEALAAKDADAISTLLADEFDFRALTPGRFWEATKAAEVLDVLFDNWFEDDDHIESVSVHDEDDVEDTAHVTYRLAVTNGDGPHTVEQTAYYRTEGDRISYLRVMCSGYRPVQD